MDSSDSLAPVPKCVLSVHSSLTVILRGGVGGGEVAVLIQMASYLIIIKSPYFGLGTPTLTEQVAVSCFQYGSMAEPTCLLFNSVRFLFCQLSQVSRPTAPRMYFL